MCAICVLCYLYFVLYDLPDCSGMINSHCKLTLRDIKRIIKLNEIKIMKITVEYSNIGADFTILVSFLY